MTRLPPRVIPCLLLDGEGMVKTVGFKDPRYLGDPLNIINLFNQFEVDEICLLDIEATRGKHGPDLEILRGLADECWVPLSYGGGISTIDDIRSVLEIGIEKVVLGTIAAERPEVVRRASERFGAQAIVTAVDVRRDEHGLARVWIRNASVPTGEEAASYAARMEELGAGEILLTAVEHDGAMIGYDNELIASVAAAVGIPVIANGGAGSRDDLVAPVRRGASAVAAGSLFVYRGNSRAVLVNFPERGLIESMFAWRV